MDTKELVLCTHCNKNVSKVNFDLHESHCKRFLCICPDCDETVPRDQLKEHVMDQHKEVKCKKCNKKMEQRKLMDHETDECSERMEICAFCQLELPVSILTEHSLTCGSRTEKCSDCGRYVTLKEQISHVRVCTSSSSTLLEDHLSDTANINHNKPSYKPEARKSQSVHNNNNNTNNNPGTNVLDSSDFSFSKFQKWKGDRNEDREMNDIDTCPLCHLALPVKMLAWHEKKCKLHKHLSLA